MLHNLIELIVPHLIYLLEILGVFIIAFTGIKSFIKYAARGFDFSDDIIKIELARALSLGLAFLLGGEILATMFIHDLSRVYIIASIVVIRVAITYVLHWEISSDMAHCNSFAALKEEEENKSNKVKTFS